MQMKYKLSTLLASLAVIAAGCGKASTGTPYSQPSTNTPPAAQSTPPATQPTTPPTSTTPAVDNFTINADDSSADLTSINVKKGDTVNITFKVNANTTYHGGLDFRSANVTTGTIAPGSSKTMTFTADQSFAFTPYWPSSNIQKPYTVKVNVQ